MDINLLRRISINNFVGGEVRGGEVRMFMEGGKISLCALGLYSYTHLISFHDVAKN